MFIPPRAPQYIAGHSFLYSTVAMLLISYEKQLFSSILNEDMHLPIGRLHVQFQQFRTQVAITT